MQPPNKNGLMVVVTINIEKNPDVAGLRLIPSRRVPTHGDGRQIE